MAIDLKKFQERFDKFLAEETPASFQKWLCERKAKKKYLATIKNLIKIIESLGAEHGHSLNPEFKKQLEDAKKLLQ